MVKRAPDHRLPLLLTVILLLLRRGAPAHDGGVHLLGVVLLEADGSPAAGAVVHAKAGGAGDVVVVAVAKPDGSFGLRLPNAAPGARVTFEASHPAAARGRFATTADAGVFHELVLLALPSSIAAAAADDNDDDADADDVNLAPPPHGPQVPPTTAIAGVTLLSFCVFTLQAVCCAGAPACGRPRRDDATKEDEHFCIVMTRAAPKFDKPIMQVVASARSGDARLVREFADSHRKQQAVDTFVVWGTRPARAR